MKTWCAVLALSLAANLVLGIRHDVRSRSSFDDSAPRFAPATLGKTGVDTQVSASINPADVSDHGKRMDEVLQLMRAASFPPQVAGNVLVGLWLETHPEYKVISQLRNSRDSDVRNRAIEVFKNLEAELIQEVNIRMEAYPDWELSFANMEKLKDANRQLVYGAIDGDQLVQVRAIEAEYSRQARSMSEAEAQELLRQAEDKLQGILSSEQFADYMLYNSTLPTPAAAVQSATRAVELDQTQYTQLVEIASKLRAENGLSGKALSDAMVSVYAKTLSADMFLRAGSQIDPVVGAADRFLASHTTLEKVQRVNFFVQMHDTMREIVAQSRAEERVQVAVTFSRAIDALPWANEQKRNEFETTVFGALLKRAESGGAR